MSLGGNSMEAFEYTALPARVLFGFGTIAKVADELASLGRKRAFVLSDPHHAATAAARLMGPLGELGVYLSTDAVMHTPVEVTERVLEKVVACNADCIVALGGGSTIGLAKALALRTDLAQIVLPTTMPARRRRRSSARRGMDRSRPSARLKCSPARGDPAACRRLQRARCAGRH